MFHTRFNRIVSNVIIVGCGGTGSRLIPMVAQFMKSCPAILDPFITLIDGDKVEMKNLARQNFIKQDVGRNKADVLAERYGGAIEIPIVSIPKYFRWDEDRDFSRWLGNNYSQLDPSLAVRAVGSPIVFFAVDSMRARLEILASIMYGRHRQSSWHNVMPIIIDAGNENTFGQVSVYHAAVAPNKADFVTTSDYRRMWDTLEAIHKTKANYVGGDLNLNFRPAPVKMLLDALVTPSEADVSCADLDQTAAINAQMATAMFTAFQNICLNHKMPILTSYFDIHNGNSQQKIDDWLMGMDNIKSISTSQDTIRGAFTKYCKDNPGNTIPKEMERLASVLADGLTGNDVQQVYAVAQEIKTATTSGALTKRNLELEALLNGRAA